MTMGPALRKLTFTAHLTSSLAWAGAVVVFLALAVVGLTSRDEGVIAIAILLLLALLHVSGYGPGL